MKLTSVSLFVILTIVKKLVNHLGALHQILFLTMPDFAGAELLPALPNRWNSRENCGATTTSAYKMPIAMQKDQSPRSRRCADRSFCFEASNRKISIAPE